MKHALPTRRLPARPNLYQLKLQAKELLDAFLSGDSAAVEEVQRFYRYPDTAAFALHDAQLTLARSYGYDSWPKLKAFVDGVTVKRLIEAVQAGDIQAVRSILDARPELVNTVAGPNDERRALHHAVLGRMPEMVRMLLRYGASPYVRFSPHPEASIPLVIAAERGYDEITAVFREELSKGPAIPDAAGELSAALHTQNEDRVLEILTQRPAVLDFQTSHGRSLLHIASTMLMSRVAVWLLDHGADANAKAPSDWTPLESLGRSSNQDPKAERLANLLRERGAKLTPRAAVVLGDKAFLQARHAEGNLAASPDEAGSLLQLAVEHDRPDLLDLLLSWGLDPDARVRVPDVDEVALTWGQPLFQCVRNKKHRMAEILLAHGADPNAQVYASGTPMSEAFGQRDEAMIALLERYGGKPNPSMAGLYRRKDLALRMLAEYGDVSLPDDGFGSGTVAEQLVAAAARGGDPEILKLGLAHIHWPYTGPRWYGPLQGPLGFWNHYGPWGQREWDRGSYLECFKLILDRTGPPNQPLRFGSTILHHIVMMGDHITADERLAFATAALDAGARLDVRDELLQSTPLGWACRVGRSELVRLFLDRGADPVEPDAEPWATPLAWAEKKEKADIAAMLRATINGAGDRP